MRGLVGPALASAAVMLVLAPAAAQISQNWAGCVNQGDAFPADQRISACTSIIQSGRETRRNLAIAYYSRGLAYYDKGDDDRAIADYNEAIRLDPKICLRLHQPRHRLGPQGRPRPRHRRLQRGDPARSRNMPQPTTTAATRITQKGDDDRAIADYNEAIRLDPEICLRLQQPRHRV